MAASPTGLEPDNECAGEPAEIVNEDPSSRQRGCYIRTMTAGVQLRKKNLAVILKGVGAKMN
jgi:hypothetical protein